MSKPKVPQIILVTCLLIILIDFSPGCLDDLEKARSSIRYYAFINSTGSIEVLFPGPVLDQVESRIAKDNGPGEVRDVDTPYGRCIRVTTDSKIEASGTWYPKTDAEHAAMTINLTTMVPGETAPYYFNNRTLPDRHAMIHIDVNQSGHIRLAIYMRPPKGYCYSFIWDARLENVSSGWSSILMDGRAYMESAP